MIGTRLDKWIIDREIGRGGMGVVYRAHEESAPDKKAAVKVLAAELAREPRFHLRFQREIAALSLLEHPNIVRLYASGAQNGLSFYAMEYVDGRNFDDILQEKSRLPWAEVLALALQVCPALKHAHDRGIIHRDLKPANLMRATSGIIKLTDFGIAKVFASTPLTATGGFVGTAEYISPEQAAGKPATKRSDLYSLGVVLYTLLVGRPPFESASLIDLLHKHRYAQFDPPRKLLPELPYEIDEIVCQLLEKDPSKRPADGLVLLKELDRIKRKLERKANPTSADARSAATRPDHADSVSGLADSPGAATLMSRMMREELEKSYRGGPLAQLFNSPWVLVPLFLLCVGLIVWGFRRNRVGPDQLFAQAQPLMESDDPAQWDRAWSDYLEPLERRYPNHAYQEQVEEYRLRGDQLMVQRKAIRAAKAATQSEARRVYQRGLRLCQDGSIDEARRVWQELIDVFDGVEGERRWVSLAERGLDQLSEKLPPSDRRWDAVRKALARAQELDKKEAEKVWTGIEELYRDDPAAKPILEQVHRDRAAKK